MCIRDSLYSIRDGIVTIQSDFPVGLTVLDCNSDNKLYLPYQDSIGQYDDGQFEFVLEIPDLNPGIFSFPPYSAYFLDSQNRHWIAPNFDQVIQLYENGHWTTFNVDSGVTQFYEPSPGRVFFSTRNTFGEYKDGVLTETAFVDINPLLVDNNVLLLMETPDIFWMHSGENIRDHRLYRVGPGFITEYGFNEDFPIEFMFDISQDCGGNLLLSGPNRLLKYDKDHWDTHAIESRNPNCFHHDFINSPVECQTFLLGGFGSCHSVWEWQDTLLQETDILPTNTFAACFDKTGNLYMSNRVNGLPSVTRIDSVGVLKHFSILDSDSFSVSACIYSEKNNELLAIANDKIFILKDEKFEKLDLSVVGEVDLWSYFYEDSEGDIWFLDSDRLLVYDGIEVKAFAVTIPSDDHLRSMTEDSQGSFWLATRNSGIAYWDKTNLIYYNAENSELLSNECFDVELTNDTTLWVIFMVLQK